MKPPVCHLCDKAFDYGWIANRPVGGDLVKFKNYQPLPNDMDGHPQGAEWFWTKHEAAARKLSNLGLEDAMKRLRRRWFFW